MSASFVTFRLAGRVLACPLHEVREVVRAVGIEPLLGAVPPLRGLLELRGEPLPVADPRPDPEPGSCADVLVLMPPRSGGQSFAELVGAGLPTSGAVGVVVDEVLEVLAAEELPPLAGSAPSGLPGYVVEIRRDLAGRTVMVVDPRRLAGL